MTNKSICIDGNVIDIDTICVKVLSYISDGIVEIDEGLFVVEKLINYKLYGNLPIESFLWNNTKKDFLNLIYVLYKKDCISLLSKAMEEKSAGKLVSWDEASDLRGTTILEDSKEEQMSEDECEV